MPDKSIEKFLIPPKMNLHSAMEKLDESHRKTLLVADREKILKGIITDGDIRRWIIRGKSMQATVELVCNQNPITSPPEYEINNIKKLMLENKIQAIPIINSDLKILDLLFWDSIFHDENFISKKNKLNIPVMIMAGGAGTRLEPFTKILPKPLIPVGDKTIIEVIIDKFREYQIKNYFLSVYHKSKLLKAYFEETNPPYKINYIEEKKPLGTAGALGYLKGKIKDSIFLTNCDTIINCDYSDMKDFHQENKYDITLAGSMINYKIPYGICQIEKEGKLVSIKEKPEHPYLVSTGMYIVKNNAIDVIPLGELYNMTDLISKVIKEGGSVGVYPIGNNSWMDTGEWKEYKKTVSILSK